MNLVEKYQRGGPTPRVEGPEGPGDALLRLPEHRRQGGGRDRRRATEAWFSFGFENRMEVVGGTEPVRTSINILLRKTDLSNRRAMEAEGGCFIRWIQCNESPPLMARTCRGGGCGGRSKGLHTGEASIHKPTGHGRWRMLRLR